MGHSCIYIPIYMPYLMISPHSCEGKSFLISPDPAWEASVKPASISFGWGIADLFQRERFPLLWYYFESASMIGN